MCKSSFSTIGRFSLLVLFFLSCSALLSAQPTTSKQPSAAQAALQPSSSDGSTSPQTSNQPMPQLPPPPELPTMQLEKSLPISEQRRMALETWTNFWTEQELPWRNQLQVWLGQVKSSWKSQKALEQKQAADTEAALKAKDDVIAAQAEEIKALEAKLSAGWFEKLGYALGGAGLGYVAGHLTK